MKTIKKPMTLCLLLALIDIAGAEVLYFDDFGGSSTVDLHGQAPLINAFGGGEKWTAHTSWKTDGNALDSPSSATLPFAPEVGKVYQITVPFESINFGSGTENWMGMGFAQGSSTSSNNSSRFVSGTVQGAPWMMKTQGQPTGITYGGPGAAAAVRYSGSWTEPVEMRLILDTRPDIWQSTWQIRNSSVSAFTTLRRDDWPVNPTITTVGMVNNSTVGKVGSFLLEDVLGDSDPSPTYGQANVNPATPKLTWNASTRANLTGYYLYMVAEVPDFAGAVPTLIAPAAGLVEADMPITLEMDKTYYWRVEEQINGAPAGDASNPVGKTWNFETQKTAPVVVTQPVIQQVNLGKTATFSVEVTSPSETTIQWYYSATNVATPEADAPVGDNTAVLNVIGNLASEGYYYCKVTNLDDETISEVAGLVIKRLLARYNFEENANDSSPWSPTFDGQWVGNPVYGPGMVGNLASSFNGADYVSVASESHPFNPNQVDPRYVSISFWYRARTPASTSPMAILGATETGANNSVQLAFNDGEGVIRLYLRSASDATTPGSINFVAETETVDPLDGEWHHLAFTWDLGSRGVGAKFYVDGKLETYYPARLDLFFSDWLENIYVGARNNRGSAIQQLDGLLDDLRIYNYPLEQSELISLGALKFESIMRAPEGVTLKWIASASIAGVDIYRSTDLQNWGAPISVNNLEGTYTDTALLPDRAFYMAVPTGEPAP